MKFLKLAFGWLEPFARLAKGENPKEQPTIIFRGFMIPAAGILVFLMIWSAAASKIDTSLGTFPGPQQVYEQSINLIAEHREEREKAAAFYERQKKRNAKKLAKNPDAEVKIRPYTGKPTFIDQIWTSLLTVMSGFLLA